MLGVGLFQHLYLTLSQNGLSNTYIWPWLVRKACLAITSDHERNTSTIMSEWPSPHILPWKEINPLTMSEWTNPYIRPWKELNPLTMLEWHNPYIWPWKELNPLTMSEWHSSYFWPWKELNPRTMSEWQSPYIWPWLVRKALSPRLRVPGNWPGASIQRMETTLISDQVGTYPSITLEWPCTYIWSCETTSHSHIRMALSPRLSIFGN